MEGKIINGFMLIRLLGVGGMAEVWYAENEIHLPAAVKILNTMLSNSEAIVERFRQEAEIMVKLRHPNIRQVYGYGSIDGRPAIIMEYLDGNDLGERLKKGERFSNSDLIRWWNQLVDALTYTHRRAIVHRDIKPANIFVDVDGNVKLLDFGIAKIKESISMTRTGMMMGTLTYMSPEQVMDSKWVGPESDYYSLAVTFVHLMTGRTPYDVTTQSDYHIRRSIVETPLDLTILPADWQAFLRPLLVKPPEKRGELKHFEVVAAPKQVEEPVVKTPEPPKKKSKHTGLWVVLIILLLGLGAAAGYKFWPDPDTETYEACRDVAGYRSYISYYGKGAKHYMEAKRIIDQHVADSVARDEEMRENLAYQACKTIADCNSYLQNYPRGRYVSQVNAKKSELEEQEAYNKCTTIAACNNYLKDYPNGRYVNDVKSKKRQLEQAAAAFQNKSFTVNGVTFDMIAVKGGTFTMGCTYDQGSSCYDDEYPSHVVTVSNYYIGKYEVTQKLWRAVMGTNPSRFKGDNLPVECVSWNDCQEFIRKLNQMTGMKFRLPTEAEWEYAARGGNKSKHYKYSGSNNVDEVAWYTGTTGDTSPRNVGTKKSNELGIYDMSGNVWEWCQDYYGSYSSSSQTNPTGPYSGNARVRRGGSWYLGERTSRVTTRQSNDPDKKGEWYGFRIVLVP